MSDRPANSAARPPSRADVVPAPESDRTLLQRFAVERDEAAFTVLVERHGPMVLDVCRRVLHDAHEAEDACQATFLVLARKCGSLQQPELLANWLYGVAYRSARKAQRQKVRYCAHAMRGASMRATDATAELVWQDLRPVLDEELDRLPAKFRAPVVLCYLEGLKAEEAARRLGCPRGTILSRLARARQRLGSRLAKRGLALSSGFLGLLLTRKATASESLSIEFVKSTVSAARLFAIPQTAGARRIGERVNSIAQGVLTAMILAKLKYIAMFVLVFGVGLVGITTAVWIGLALGAQHGVVSATETQGPVDEQSSNAEQDKQRLQGAWREVGLENAGGKVPPEQLKTFRWIIEGDGFLMVDDNQGPMNVKFAYRLDAATRPKSIDISANGMPCWIAIYELGADKLRICTAAAGAPRPTAFIVGGKDDKLIWEFKREPADQDPAPAKRP
jgi:RNA polymerase sigma factor (sigma-70 family)